MDKYDEAIILIAEQDRADWRMILAALELLSAPIDRRRLAARLFPGSSAEYRTQWADASPLTCWARLDPRCRALAMRIIRARLLPGLRENCATID